MTSHTCPRSLHLCSSPDRPFLHFSWMKASRPLSVSRCHPYNGSHSLSSHIITAEGREKPCVPSLHQRTHPGPGPQTRCSAEMRARQPSPTPSLSPFTLGKGKKLEGCYGHTAVLSLLSNNPKLSSLLETRSLIAKPGRQPGCFPRGTGRLRP